MFDFVRNRFALSFLTLILCFVSLLSFVACNKKENPETAQAPPKTFASPDEAGKALGDAAKSQNQEAILAIFGPRSAEIMSTGNPAEDKAALEGFAQAYQVMNRWRKLADGSEVLLVGADNQPFPIPLMKNPAGQWYFDAAAGKEEILARRIGRDELAAMDVCAALADSQAQYYSQKHGGVKQYAQKFISDSGQQNGLYWESPQGSPRSPLGPLVAFATEEGFTVKPDAHQPFYGYYFRQLDSQGPDAKGAAKAREGVVEWNRLRINDVLLARSEIETRQIVWKYAVLAQDFATPLVVRVAGRDSCVRNEFHCSLTEERTTAADVRVTVD